MTTVQEDHNLKIPKKKIKIINCFFNNNNSSSNSSSNTNSISSNNISMARITMIMMNYFIHILLPTQKFL
jgi:hypothetical protein